MINKFTQSFNNGMSLKTEKINEKLFTRILQIWIQNQSFIFVTSNTLTTGFYSIRKFEQEISKHLTKFYSKIKIKQSRKNLIINCTSINWIWDKRHIYKKWLFWWNLFLRTSGMDELKDLSQINSEKIILSRLKVANSVKKITSETVFHVYIKLHFFCFGGSCVA